MGLFNDYAVQQDSLRAFLDEQSELNRARFAPIAQSIGALIDILHQQQAEERARVMVSFAKFDSDDVRGVFRRLFQEEGSGA